jgi:hypothetical protein
MKITLEVWSQKFDIPIERVGQSARRYVYMDISPHGPQREAYQDLHNLIDYQVSSLCGPMIWLVPVSSDHERRCYERNQQRLMGNEPEGW